MKKSEWMRFRPTPCPKRLLRSTSCSIICALSFIAAADNAALAQENKDSKKGDLKAIIQSIHENHLGGTSEALNKYTARYDDQQLAKRALIGGIDRLESEAKSHFEAKKKGGPAASGIDLLKYPVPGGGGVPENLPKGRPGTWEIKSPFIFGGGANWKKGPYWGKKEDLRREVIALRTDRATITARWRELEDGWLKATLEYPLKRMTEQLAEEKKEAEEFWKKQQGKQNNAFNNAFVGVGTGRFYPGHWEAKHVEDKELLAYLGRSGWAGTYRDYWKLKDEILEKKVNEAKRRFQEDFLHRYVKGGNSCGSLSSLEIAGIYDQARLDPIYQFATTKLMSAQHWNSGLGYAIGPPHQIQYTPAQLEIREDVLSGAIVRVMLYRKYCTQDINTMLSWVHLNNLQHTPTNQPFKNTTTGISSPGDACGAPEVTAVKELHSLSHNLKFDKIAADSDLKSALAEDEVAKLPDFIPSLSDTLFGLNDSLVQEFTQAAAQANIPAILQKRVEQAVDAFGEGLKKKHGMGPSSKTTNALKAHWGKILPPLQKALRGGGQALDAFEAKFGVRPVASPQYPQIKIPGYSSENAAATASIAKKASKFLSSTAQQAPYLISVGVAIYNLSVVANGGGWEKLSPGQQLELITAWVPVMGSAFSLMSAVQAGDKLGIINGAVGVATGLLSAAFPVLAPLFALTYAITALVTWIIGQGRQVDVVWDQFAVDRERRLSLETGEAARLLNYEYWELTPCRVPVWDIVASGHPEFGSQNVLLKGVG
ncbi:hypothetical protein [Streptomyces syringium]|uniref:hypothetical protein n=1 Tax=Streptomyces syringium TaxID=76729 RepID=UPI0033FB295B